MPDSYTTYFGLVKPEQGASRDTWGTKTNSNWDVVDEFLFYSAPVGMIIDFAGPQAPPGYLVCDGRLISRQTYSDLFNVIGTYWGAGDGSTTFALPPTPGRSCIGPGQVIDELGNTVSYTFAQQLGAVSRSIAQANLPSYPMTSDVEGLHSHGGATAPGGSHTHTTDTQGFHGHGVNDPGHGHGVSDPGHAHSLYFYSIAAVGGYGGDAYVVSGGTYENTNSSGTGISIQGSGTGIGIYGDGSHAHNVNPSGNLQLGIYNDGNHQHTIWSGGSGVQLATMNPVLVCTKIIYAGQQAVSRALTQAIDPSARRLLRAPVRGSH